MQALLFITYVLCAQATSAAQKAAQLTKAIDALQKQKDECDASKKWAVDPSSTEDIELKFKPAVEQALLGFTSRREELEAKFKSAEDQAQSAIDANSSDVTAALGDLHNALHDIGHLLRHERSAVAHALHTIIHQSLKPKKDTKLQSKHEAHSAINPLYGMGDDAEDYADKFNDEWVEASNCVTDSIDHVARRLERVADHIGHMAIGHFQEEQDARIAEEHRLQAAVAAPATQLAALTLASFRPVGSPLFFSPLLVSSMVGGVLLFLAARFLRSSSAQNSLPPLLQQ